MSLGRAGRDAGWQARATQRMTGGTDQFADNAGRQQAPSPRAALVTGGARRIGRAIALALARAGYAVAVHANRSRAEAEALAAEIAARAGAPPWCSPISPTRRRCAGSCRRRPPRSGR